MNRRRIKNWQELFIAGVVVAALEMTVMQPFAMAAIDVLSMKPPTAMNAISKLSQVQVAAGACEECVMPAMPAPLRDGETDLVITTTLTDGGYVAVWQSKSDNLVHGQCHTRDGQPRGAEFHINMEVSDDGLLPVIIIQPNGGFLARWERDGKRFEQRFDLQGAPMAEALAK